MSLTFSQMQSILHEIIPLLEGSRFSHCTTIQPRKFLLHFENEKQLLICLQHPFLRFHMTQHPWKEMAHGFSKQVTQYLHHWQLNKCAEVGFAYGNVLWFKEGAPLPRARTRRPSWSIWPGRAWLERRFRHGRSGISSPEVVVRTELQKQVGGYDPRMPHLGDTQMWLRMAARADVGYLRGVDQAYYRRHPDNMSSGYTQAMTLEQHLFVFESVLDECAETPDERKRLSDLVRRKAAWDALETAARAYDRGRTADTPVEELVAFALRSWPAARSFPIYHTLQARRRIGPRAVPYLRPLVMPALAARKAESWWLGLPAVRPLLSSGTWERYR